MLNKTKIKQLIVKSRFFSGKKRIESIKTAMLALLMTATVASANAQNNKPLAAVLGIESKGVIQTSEDLSFLVHLELEKMNVYNVIDKYDLAERVKENKIDEKTCLGKTCLVDAGKSLKVDKIITGSVERLGEKIVISMKMLDIKSENVEKQDVTEYLNLQPEMQKMLTVSLKKLLGMEPDKEIVSLLVNYDMPISTPRTKVRLNGPRMGCTHTSGKTGDLLIAPESKGGYDMYPVNFVFGWQQEWQYLSSGSFQGLVEIIPLIGGLESGRFIPSVTFLNGFRFGKGNWEFAFGPNFRIIEKARGFYDTKGYFGEKGEWYRESEWKQQNLADTTVKINSLKEYSTVSRLDSRGTPQLSYSLVFAIGKTFNSGYLNMPVNAFVSLGKDATTVGLSLGFNVVKKPKLK